MEVYRGTPDDECTAPKELEHGEFPSPIYLKANMSIALQRIDQHINEWLRKCLNSNQTELSDYTLELIRTADYHMHLVASPFRGHPSIDSRTIVAGLKLMLSYFLPLIEGEITPLNELRSNPKLSETAEQDLLIAGRLWKLQHLAGQEEMGQLVWSQTAAPNHIIIRRRELDLNQFERADEDWLIDADRVHTTPIRNSINGKLMALTSRPIDEYTSLKNNEKIYKKFDTEFFRLSKSWQEIAFYEYNDSHLIPDNSVIGGRAFSEWRDLATTVAAHLFMRRLNAVRIVKENQLGIYALKDLMTEIIDVSEFPSILRDSEDSVGNESPHDLLSAFFLDSETAKLYKEKRDVSAPYGVRVGDKIILTHFGYLGNMSSFLLGYLKHTFGKDWDKAVNEREELLQEQLERLFSDKGYTFGKRLVGVKTDIGNTDTDWAAYETETNTVYIFQLKYPSTWAYNHNERGSQQKNFRESCNTWIKKILRWIELNKKEELLKRLNLLGAVTDIENLTFQLVVLSRFDTRFDSKADGYNRDAAWLSWPRLRRLVSECPEGNPPIRHAWATCSKPENLTHVPNFYFTRHQFDGLRVDVYQ